MVRVGRALKCVNTPAGVVGVANAKHCVSILTAMYSSDIQSVRAEAPWLWIITANKKSISRAHVTVTDCITHIAEGVCGVTMDLYQRMTR